MAAKVKALQEWCRRQCEGYRDVTVTNMTSSWKSGMAFCAIIHRYRPDLIDYDSLKKEDVFENNQLAFDTAQDLGIAALLDAEDMVAMRVPDKLCIVTYVSQYHNFFRNKAQLGGPGVHRTGSVGVKRPQSTPPAGGPDAKKSSTDNLHTRLQNKENDSTKAIPSKQGSIGEICHMCKKKVYLMERHIDENRRLYHRKCIRESQRADSLQRNKHLSSLSDPYKKEQSRSKPNYKDAFNSSSNRYIVPNVTHKMDTAKPSHKTENSPSPISTAVPTVQAVKSQYSPQCASPSASISKDSDSDESRSASPSKSNNLFKSLYGVSSYKSPFSGSPVKPLAASTPAEQAEKIGKHSPVRPQSVALKGQCAQTTTSKFSVDMSPTSTPSKGDEMRKKWLSEEKVSPSKRETKTFEERMSPQHMSPSSPVSSSSKFSFSSKSAPENGDSSVLSGLLNSLANVRSKQHETSSPGASYKPISVSDVSPKGPSSPRSLSPSPPRSILKRGSDEGFNDMGHELPRSMPRPILKNKGESPIDPASPPKTSQPARSILKNTSETPISSVEAKPALKRSPGSDSTQVSPKSVLKTPSESYEEPMSVSPPRSALKLKHESFDLSPRPILKTGYKDPASSSLSNQPKPILKTKEQDKLPGTHAQQSKEPRSILRKSSSDESAEKKSTGWMSWLRSNKSEDSSTDHSQMSNPEATHFHSGNSSVKNQPLSNNTSAFNITDCIQNAKPKDNSQTVSSWKIPEKPARNSSPQIHSKGHAIQNKSDTKPAYGKGSEDKIGPQRPPRPQWIVEAEKRQAARGGKYEDPEKKYLNKDSDKVQGGARPKGSPSGTPLKEFQSSPKTEKLSSGSIITVGEKGSPRKEVRTAKIVYVEDGKGSPQPHGEFLEKSSRGQTSSKAVDTETKDKLARTVIDKAKMGFPSSHAETGRLVSGNKQNNVPVKFPQKQMDNVPQSGNLDSQRKSGGLSPTRDLDMVSIVHKQLNKSQGKNRTEPTSPTSPKAELPSGTVSAKASYTTTSFVPSKKPVVNGLTSPPRKSIQDQKQDRVSSHPDSTKPDWMLEAERRKIARNGVYTDPESSKVINKERPSGSPTTSPDAFIPKKKIVPDIPFHFSRGESDLESSLEMSSPQAPKKPVRTLPGDRKSSAPTARNGHLAFNRIQNRPLPLTPRAGPQKRKVNAEARMSPWQIQRTLVDLDKQLQVMEARGRELEENIRSGTDEAMDEDEDLMVKWFELVNNKNELVRTESELMYRQKQQELEDMHSDVEYDLRCLLEKPEHLKTASDKIREESLLQQLLETVSLRNNIVDSIEEDRIRYIEEDQEIADVIAQKSFTMKNEPNEKVDKKKAKEEKKKKGKEMKQKEKELKKKEKGKKKEKKDSENGSDQ